MRCIHRHLCIHSAFYGVHSQYIERTALHVIILHLSFFAFSVVTFRCIWIHARCSTLGDLLSSGPTDVQSFFCRRQGRLRPPRARGDDSPRARKLVDGNDYKQQEWTMMARDNKRQAGGAHPSRYSLSRAALHANDAAQGAQVAMPQQGAHRPRPGTTDAPSPNSRSGTAQRTQTAGPTHPSTSTCKGKGAWDLRRRRCMRLITSGSRRWAATGHRCSKPCSSRRGSTRTTHRNVTPARDTRSPTTATSIRSAVAAHTLRHAAHTWHMRSWLFGLPLL